MVPRNREELLAYPRRSVLFWFAAQVSALRPCHTFFQWELCFPGRLTPGCRALGFGKSLSEGRNRRVCERKHKEKHDSGGKEVARVSFPWRLGKKSAIALSHSWKKKEIIAFNSKMAVFNKYFTLHLQKGRGCHIAEQEVCCYTIF